GRYVLVGAVFPGPDLRVSPEQIIRRMISIHGLHNYTPDDLAAAVSFLALNHRRFPFAGLVTKSFPLNRTKAAFDYAKKHHALRIAVKP
ncbi:MAG: alcohol dehydrogenase, partial [bacterium]|nr:alcohol dehydrogenase [bacterium]